jgi:hypothetical protein
MLEGGCFCGNIRYEVLGTPFHSTLCHCVDCRRYAAAPAIAWFSVKPSEFKIVRGEPKSFASSKAVVRTFCPDCGTPLTYRHRDFADEIDIQTCTLDTPDAVAPDDQTWTSEKLPWVDGTHRLPEHPGNRPKS